jgi:uncharacterized protein (DUF697 family)
MAHNSLIYLIPLIAAFLLFLAKVYGFERARTQGSPSFALALVSVALIIAYLTLTVLRIVPPWAGPGFGGAGVILLGLAVLLLRVY